MAGRRDRPRPDRRQNGTPPLFHMGAVLELALAQIGGELPKGILQLLLVVRYSKSRMSSAFLSLRRVMVSKS